MRLSAIALIGIGIAACTGGQVGTGECDQRLGPGDDDHAAISEALAALQSGQTLCLTGGRFVLDAPLAIDGLRDVTLTGAGEEQPEETVLDFSGQTVGDGLTITGASGLTLLDLVIESPAGRGVVLEESTDVRIERLTVGWTPDLLRGGDGLAIVDSSNVVVHSSSFIGSTAAGLSITGSERVLVEESVAFENLAGFALLDSSECEVRTSSAIENGLGFVVADLADGSHRASANTLRDNVAVENNAILDRPVDSWLTHLPSGVGVLILAADDTELTGNQIDTNAGAGVLILASTTLELAGAPAVQADDPYPERIHLYDNTYSENGLDPATPADPLMLELLARSDRTTLADVVWDGALAPDAELTTLCVRPSDDSLASFLNLDARMDYAMPSTDASPHDCSHPVHPPLEL